jgi:hypothetical protein
VRALALVWGLAALTAPLPAARAADPHGSHHTLKRYARDTWASFVAMTDEQTGLPADSLHIDGTRSVQTSITNIGASMWSTLVAEELGFISHDAAVARLRRTVRTLETMDCHTPSGQFFEWYDHRTGEKLTVWPPTGEPRTPILSSVVNGWLATALHLVRQRVPELAERVGALFDRMDFGFYYRPEENRILFHYAPSTGEAPCCYDTIVSESRIASYIGIAKGDLPPRHYFGTWRSFPKTCDSNWQETRPRGMQRTYYDVPVFEGAYRYAGRRLVPSWGGSMFDGAGAHPSRAGRSPVWLLGLLARQHSGRRLRHLRGRWHRHESGGLCLQ